MKRLYVTLGLILLLAVSAAGQTSVLVANASTTGTSVNTLTKLTGAPSTAVISATTDSASLIEGITINGAGTTGNATIGKLGLMQCVFDGATTANDAVVLSTTTGGDCHDAGSAPPVSGCLAKVLSTNASAGTYTVDFGGTSCAIGSGGTINNAAQYDAPYYSASGTTNTLSGAAISGFQFDSTSGPPAAGTAANLGALLSIAQYDLLLSGGSSAAPVGVAPSSTTGYPLLSNGASANPSFGTALASGVTATTQSAGNNSTDLATTAYTNTVYNLIQTSGSPYTMSAITGTYWNNTTSAYSWDLPTPVAGLQICVGNYQAQATAQSLIPPSGVTIYFKGVAGTAGSSTGLVSGGAAGDFICVEGTSSTTYMAIGAGYGTWTNH